MKGFTSECEVHSSMYEICGVLNGSNVGCGGIGIRNLYVFEEDVIFPMSMLNYGRNWLTLELIDTHFHIGDNRRIVISTQPIILNTYDASLMHSINDEIINKDLEENQRISGDQSAIDPVPSVTLVLTLTLKDLPRALVLLSSLGTFLHCSNNLHDDLPKCWLKKLLIIVPDDDVVMIRTLLASTSGGKVEVIPESILLGFQPHKRSEELQFYIDGYAVQMALKLLVAKIVESDYYLTLDADVINTRTFNTSDLFTWQTQNNIYDKRKGGKWKAKFTPESQDAHVHWWQGATNTLGYYHGSDDAAQVDYQPDSTAKFGVTPALLSTFGSMVVLKRLEEVFSTVEEGEDGLGHGQSVPWVERWLMRWGDGYWWSEYTLYTLALHHHKVFEHLHHPAADALDELSCRSVWFTPDKQWNASEIFHPAPQVGHSDSKTTCPFTLVQSSSGVDGAFIASQVKYELTRAHRDLVDTYGSLVTMPHFASIFERR